MKTYLIIILLLLAACGKNTTTPNSTKAEYKIGENKYLKNESITLTNTSIGLTKQEWYDNGVLFSTAINPDVKIFTTGKHIIELIGNSANGQLYNYKDSFEVYEKFKINEFKIKNLTNISIQNDSTTGHMVGLLSNDVQRNNAWILMTRQNNSYFTSFYSDTAFKSNIYLNNSYFKTINNIDAITLSNILLFDLLKNCSFLIYKTSVTVSGGYGILYDKQIKTYKNDFHTNTISIKTDDFEILLNGVWFL